MKKREKGEQKFYLKKNVAENFPNLGKETDTQIQEPQRNAI